MNTTNRFDAGNFDLEFAPKRAVIRTGAMFQHIDDAQSLFCWMWEQLENSEPKVAVFGFVPECLDKVCQTLASGRSMTPPTEWPVIFSEVEWHDPRSYDARQCSIALLAFLGHLSAYARSTGKWEISTSEACGMIQECSFRSGKYLVYQD